VENNFLQAEDTPRGGRVSKSCQGDGEPQDLGLVQKKKNLNVETGLWGVDVTSSILQKRQKQGWGWKVVKKKN